MKVTVKKIIKNDDIIQIIDQNICFQEIDYHCIEAIHITKDMVELIHELGDGKESIICLDPNEVMIKWVLIGADTNQIELLKYNNEKNKRKSGS